MFARFHSLIALLSVALHLLDIAVAAGHQHVHAAGETCADVCSAECQTVTHSHKQSHGHGCGTHKHEHSHAHSHSHCHSPAAACEPKSCDPHSCDPASQPHHDCAICQHLALTPALVSPASPCISPSGSEPVVGEIATLRPPLRTVQCRSRAPPVSLT